MKPYDVEQAKAEIRERAKALVDVNREEIDRVVESALKRLEAEAGAFKDLKSETLGSLFRDASAVLIEEFTAHPVPSHLKDPGNLEVHMDLRIGGPDGTQISAGLPRYEGSHRGMALIPNQKHRMIVFFMPVEE